MATLREIRRRIRAVKNLAKVTRAMQMVATSKMQRAQERAQATRPYAQKAWDILTHLAAQRRAEEEMHPLCRFREVETVGLVLITADRGLCGGYNHSIIRTTLEFIQHQTKPIKLIAVGRKGRDFMMRLGMEIIAEFTNLPAQPTILDVAPIARTTIDDFVAGKFDVVYLAYTNFINTLQYKPMVKRLLPIHPSMAEELAMREYVERPLPQPQPEYEYIYEPDPRTILDTVLPRFTELQIYQAILESAASEHSARMVAMRNATENAQDIISELTLTYNRARQEAITKEIIDIAGGAEALARARAVR
ncbi:MAG: ATP synthase F1 subunit gamma [Anaerolineae bacterium]